jgi:hypothetical protein
VEAFETDIALLPQLAQLTDLVLARLYFNLWGLCQFLNQCPALTTCQVRDVRPHLPDQVTFSGGRRVLLKQS